VGGYPVGGGLSQTAVNEKAGACSRLSLVFASLALTLCLLFFTGLVADLPRAVLAAVVLIAVRGLIDLRALFHMWRASRVDLLCALAALIGVLLLGILQGIVLAALVSVVLLLTRHSTPHVAFLGRIPGTRHPDNEPLTRMLAFRPEASLSYLNADYVLTRVLERLAIVDTEGIKRVVCDLSGSPQIDLAGARMLARLSDYLHTQGINLTIVAAHGRVRDLLRADGLDSSIQGLARGNVLEDVLGDA
jgi:sulfate permease, SulP family